MRYRFQNTNLLNNGFTIVELLVVVSIISLLSSIVFASVNVAQAKGRDARKDADMASVRTAITGYMADHKDAPPNYNGNYLAVEDLAHPNDSQTNASGIAYNQFMDDLVSGKYLSAPVYSPPGSIAPYTYYNYGSDSAGAVFATIFETIPSTSTGPTNSCRPWVTTTDNQAVCLVATNGLNTESLSDQSEFAAVDGRISRPAGVDPIPREYVQHLQYQKCLLKTQDQICPDDNPNCNNTDSSYENLCMQQPSQAVCYCMK